MIQSAKVIDPDKPFFMYLVAGVRARSAPRVQGVGRQVQGEVRPGLRSHPRRHPRTAEGARAAARRHRAVADQPARRARRGRVPTVSPGRCSTPCVRGTRSPTTSSASSRAWRRCSPGSSSYTDDQIGRVLDYLEASGQLDNTIVVVVSDNGASGEGGPNGSFNEWRFFNGVPDTTEATLPHIDDLGTPKSYNHYCTGWAWAFDTPFPYWKRWAGYEGGVADMCLVAWPKQIKPSKDVRQQYIHAVDIVPTVYDLLGIEPPAVIKGYTQSPIEGESFAAALTDPTAPGKETQFYAMLGQRSIYHQGWLACTVHPPIGGWGKFEHDEWELYDLEHDRSQSKNLAADRTGAARDAEEPVVLLRRDLQRAAARRPHRARAGARRTTPRRTRPAAVHLLPARRRRPRVVRRRDQRPVVHDRRGRRDRLGRRRGRAVRARRRRRRPQPLRQGQEAALHVQLARHEALRRRRRHRDHARAARPHRRVRVEGTEHRSGDARASRDA